MWRYLTFLAIPFVLTLWGCKGDGNNQLNPPRTNLLDTTAPGQSRPSVSFTDIANSFETPERENWQKPQMVISLLGDLSDLTIADIGAGTGYFSLRLAEKAEKVIAIDIDSLFLDYIDHRISEGKLAHRLNVETRLTTPDDPGLRPAETDIVLFVNTYHLLENRPEYFRKVKPGLKPGGRIVIIDFKDGNMPVGPVQEERISWHQASGEMQEAGYKMMSVDTVSLDYQYILTLK